MDKAKINRINQTVKSVLDTIPWFSPSLGLKQVSNLRLKVQQSICAAAANGRNSFKLFSSQDHVASDQPVENDEKFLFDFI